MTIKINIYTTLSPRSSNYMRKNFGKHGFTVYVLLRFFWITTLPNIWRKICFSKTLHQGFSIKWKVKDPILRTAFHWYYKNWLFWKNLQISARKTYFLFKSVNSKFLHYVNQFGHFRLYFVTVFSLVYA